MNASNIQICLARRPSGWVRETDFNVVRTGIPNPGEGQVLLKNLYLSLDPYMRLRMDDAKSYAPPVEIGAVMVGGTVSEVIESRHPGYRPGDTVTGMAGWQLYGLSDGKMLCARWTRRWRPCRLHLAWWVSLELPHGSACSTSAFPRQARR